MSERFTISSEILVQLIERGSTDATQAAIRDINVYQEQNIHINEDATRSSQRYGVSLRRVALDLRMMAIGLRILRQEYGGISPVVDVAITALYQFSAVGAVLIGGFGLASNSMAAFRRAAGDAKTNMDALRHVVAATAFGVPVLGIAFAALAAVISFQWAYNVASGIGAITKEVKRLEEGLKDVQGELRNLSVEEGYLNAQSAALSAQIADLERVIDLQGFATDEQTARLKSLKATLADVGVTMGYAQAESAMYRADIVQTTDSIADLKEMAQEANKAVIQFIFGGGGRGPGGAARAPGVGGGAIPEQQLGGRVRKRGAVSVEPGEVIMQREQVATMMAGGQGGEGGISVTISLAGANINGVKDLEGTLRRGGEAATEEIRRLNLLRRRGRSRF